MPTEKRSSVTRCHGCGKLLEQSAGQEQKPCPFCGDTRREYIEDVVVCIKVRTGVRDKHMRPGKRRPIAEGRNEPVYSRDSGKLVKLVRHIDREHNKYKEVVTDPDTGEVIHECEEALSDHRGHGNAKIM